MDEEKLYNSEDESLEDEEQVMFERCRLNVDKGQTPMRIDKYMATHLEDTSRHRVRGQSMRNIASSFRTVSIYAPGRLSMPRP